MVKWIAIPVGAVVVCVTGFVIFYDSVSRMIDRIARIGPEGITLIEHVQTVNITLDTGSGSVADLDRVRTELAERATQLLGMHPVAFSYLIRSAACSFWNLTEIERANQLRHLREIKSKQLGELYAIRTNDIRQRLGGEGLQVIFNDKGRFLLTAFEVSPEPCVPHPAAVLIE